MQYLILILTVLSNTMIMSSDTLSFFCEENELETDIKGGAGINYLISHKGPLHNPSSYRILEAQLLCDDYSQALSIAYELHNNTLLAACVESWSSSRAQEEGKEQVGLFHKKFPADIRMRAAQLWYCAQTDKTDVWPYVQRIRTIIINLPNDRSVEDYVALEEGRIQAIQAWLKKRESLLKAKK